jgi:AcrR family transcriptional regulator
MSVSNRQIGEAAGQANNSVVGYHFGTKADLSLAIVRSHAADIELRRTTLLAALEPPVDLRAWLAIVVRPITDHLEALGTPSFYARFVAQATSSPTLGPLLHDETVAASTMHAPFREVMRMLAGLPKHVLEERTDMTRHIVVSVCAERERALHLALPTPRKTWADAACGIVDALTGLWLAPVAGARLRPPRNQKETP